MPLLQGKAALVTGAGSGIGRSTALLFAQEGASVVLVARRASAIEAVVHDIERAGGRAIACAGDVTSESAHAAATQLASERFGRLDVAFNNAGVVGDLKPLADLSTQAWSKVIATNLTAAFLGARLQIPEMLRSGGGTLLFTSSFVGNSVGLPGMGAYAASKAGLVGLVKGITADYGAQGIRANAILPGGTDTDMAGSSEHREWAACLHAMKRIADPAEIARAALFLASDMSSFVSGSSLWVDGGNSAVKL